MPTRYDQIADALRAEIYHGRYQPGEKLPSENDLMRDYAVARNTARQALSVIVREGLAVPKQGTGTIVTSPDMYTWEDCSRDLALLTPLTHLEAIEITFDLSRIQAGDPEDLLPLLVALERPGTTKDRLQALSHLIENVINWRDEAADVADAARTEER